MKTENNGNLGMKVGGKIIVLSGLDVFTIKGFTNRTEVKRGDLLETIKYEEGIIELLFLRFEIELREMVSKLMYEQNSPNVEIEFFFTRLFALLKQKPWIITLIFDENLKTRHKEIEKIILRIKSFIKNYLSVPIDKGKQQSVFITTESSKTLVNNILSTLLEVKDNLQAANKMIGKLK